MQRLQIILEKITYCCQTSIFWRYCA